MTQQLLLIVRRISFDPSPHTLLPHIGRGECYVASNVTPVLVYVGNMSGVCLMNVGNVMPEGGRFEKDSYEISLAAP